MIPEEDQVRRALVVKIREVVSHPGRMEGMSIRNLHHARHYREEALATGRRAFYRKLLDMTRSA